MDVFCCHDNGLCPRSKKLKNKGYYVIKDECIVHCGV